MGGLMPSGWAPWASPTGLRLGLLAVTLLVVLLASSTVGQAEEEWKGSAPVPSPPAVTDVAWVLDPANSARVVSVTVTFAPALPDPGPGGLVCAQVTNGSPPGILANGCFPVSAGGSSATVPFDTTPSTTASASAITGVAVTVIQFVVGGPNGVRVTDVAWTLDTANITLVKQVKVTLTGLTEKVDVKLELRNGTGKLLQKKKFEDKVPNGGSITINWTLSPPVSAQAIAKFVIKVSSD